MNNDNIIIEEPKEYTIYDNLIIIQLRDIIPRNYDIIGIDFDFPENVKQVKFCIGGSYNTVNFDRDLNDYLKTFPIYLTLCKYHNVNMIIEYDKDYIESLIEYEMIDEIVYEEKLGSEATIFDGCSYHTGNIVEYDSVLTGKQIRNIVKGVKIITPEIKFIVAEINHNSHVFEQTVKQKIDISTFDSNFKKILHNNHNLIEIDDNNGYIFNKIRYLQGMAGLIYYFI